MEINKEECKIYTQFHPSDINLLKFLSIHIMVFVVVF